MERQDCRRDEYKKSEGVSRTKEKLYGKNHRGTTLCRVKRAFVSTSKKEAESGKTLPLIPQIQGEKKLFGHDLCDITGLIDLFLDGSDFFYTGDALF